MKKLAVMFFALQAAMAFAEADLFSALRTEGTEAMHFSGEGVYGDRSSDEQGEYLKGKYMKALKVTPLDTTRIHLDQHINFDGHERRYGLILELYHELITVYAPTSDDTQHDFSTYVKAGHGYVAFGGGDASKQFIFLNYLRNGDRHDQHLLIQRDDKGRLVITDSGTLGNDKEGIDKIWYGQVTQMD